MTRKDYVKLADGLGRALAMARVLDGGFSRPLGGRHDAATAAWYAIEAVVLVMMMDNARFSATRFRDAVRDAADVWANRLEGVAIG